MWGSSPLGTAVVMAEIEMHRVVIPDYVGADPTDHLKDAIEKNFFSYICRETKKEVSK